MDSPAFLQPICLVLASLAIVAGGLGMFASFVYLASHSMADSLLVPWDSSPVRSSSVLVCSR